MFEKFLLQVVPNAEQIINFKPQVGRGKVFWVCFKNQFGKVSTFLKKKVSDWVQKVYEEFSKYNWVSETAVTSPNGEMYGVTKHHCTCSDFKYHVSKGKSWRSFCKHQLMQLMNKSLTEQVTDEKAILRKYREQTSQLIKKLDSLQKETYFYEKKEVYGLTYRMDSVGLGDARFSISINGKDFGVILIDSFSQISKVQRKTKQPVVESFAQAQKRTLIKEFDNSIDALNYLLKGIDLISIEEQQARNSLFWDEPTDSEYPMQAYFEKEKAEESKPVKKKWLSLNDLQTIPF